MHPDDQDRDRDPPGDPPESPDHVDAWLHASANPPESADHANNVDHADASQQASANPPESADHVDHVDAWLHAELVALGETLSANAARLRAISRLRAARAEAMRARILRRITSN